VAITTCTNSCSENSIRCNATTTDRTDRQICQRDGVGCLKWTAAPSCVPGTFCYTNATTADKCVQPCLAQDCREGNLATYDGCSAASNECTHLSNRPRGYACNENVQCGTGNRCVQCPHAPLGCLMGPNGTCNTSQCCQ
jgi:hypothetical protein